MTLSRALMVLSVLAALLAMVMPLGVPRDLAAPASGVMVIGAYVAASVIAAAVFRLAIPPAVSGLLAVGGAVALLGAEPERPRGSAR